MKQVLNKTKHKICEVITGNKYQICYTTRTHYMFECWIDERNADYVFTKMKLWVPTIRDGKRRQEDGTYK